MSTAVAQRLRSFLASREGRASLDEVCRVAFAAQVSPQLGRRLLETTLPSELAFDGSDVLLVAAVTPADDISTARFIVVDLETTGTHPNFAEILEFGAVFVEGDRVVGEEHTLIKPAGRIPPFIQQLTGIDHDLVAAAPAFAEVAERLHGLFAGAVPVAHNAEFDYGFLRAAFAQHGLADVGHGRLCTIKLARRFAPGGKFNLDALAERLGVSTHARHRALGDARATAHVLIELLRRARAEGVQSVNALRQARARRGRGAETRLSVGPDRIRAIPSAPGVYRFRDAFGSVIYVGKAARLKDRLGSYFVGSPRGKVNRMLEEVRDFDYTVVGSELEALLEEAREIRTRRPKYNLALRSIQKYGYLRWERADPFPIVRFAREPGGRETYESYGPFRMAAGGQHELKALREVFPLRNCRGRLAPNPALSPCLEHDLGRCSAPCADLQPSHAYADEVGRLRAFLTGDRSVLTRLRAEIALAAKREEFERAAALRDRFRILGSVHQAVRREHSLANIGDRLLVLPAADSGSVRLYLVRPATTLVTCRAAVDEADWLAVVERLFAPGPSDFGALEDARIAEQWLRRKSTPPVLRTADYGSLGELAMALVTLVRAQAPALGV
jgi:DNA polymerase-3 subunit epsilon